MALEKLQCFLNEITNIHAFALAVRNGVADIDVLALENIENGEYLAVVGYLMIQVKSIRMHGVRVRGGGGTSASPISSPDTTTCCRTLSVMAIT